MREFVSFIVEEIEVDDYSENMLMLGIWVFPGLIFCKARIMPGIFYTFTLTRRFARPPCNSVTRPTPFATTTICRQGQGSRRCHVISSTG
jgi:hypothetical protein